MKNHLVIECDKLSSTLSYRRPFLLWPCATVVFKHFKSLNAICEFGSIISPILKTKIFVKIFIAVSWCDKYEMATLAFQGRGAFIFSINIVKGFNNIYNGYNEEKLCSTRYRERAKKTDENRHFERAVS